MEFTECILLLFKTDPIHILGREPLFQMSGKSDQQWVTSENLLCGTNYLEKKWSQCFNSLEDRPEQVEPTPSWVSTLTPAVLPNFLFNLGRVCSWMQSALQESKTHGVL